MAASALDLLLDTAFARDAAAGLTRAGQKELPSTYLYDDLGSILFDAITLLPEYGLTRADARLLQRHAPDIARAFPGRVLMAELGSGTGAKTRSILEAFSGRGDLKYHPIDISYSALEKCEAALDGIPDILIESLHASYLDGLRSATRNRTADQSLLVLFLGSTIGNFDPEAAQSFLAEIRGILSPSDALLLGTDLVKPVPQMLDAYDDALGVTSAFNLNVLTRMNRELGAEFEIRRFEHEARYNDAQSRIEMHIRSRQEQTVRIAGIDRVISFERGETIWTESSYKFRRAEIAQLAEKAGFEIGAQWTDAEWPFSETLLRAV